MDNIFIVEDTADNIRIDKYLKELLPDQSRSYIQKLLKDGHILVNNSIIKPNYKVKPDDRIQIDIPEPIEASRSPLFLRRRAAVCSSAGTCLPVPARTRPGRLRRRSL